MAPADFGRDVAAFRLGPKRDATPEDIGGAILRHVVSLMPELRRSGNITAVRLLREDGADFYVLLVSTDSGWSKRNQDAVEALGSDATVEDLGRFTPVDLPSGGTEDRTDDGAAADRDLGNDVRIFELRPTAGSTAADVAAVVDTHLASLVGAPPTRSGNVLNVSLLREEAADRHLLCFGVDIGTRPLNEEHLAAVRETADTAELGSFTQQTLTDEA